MSSTSVESNMRNVRLLVATWNAGNAEPDPSQFKHIMPDKGEGYDLIVIGLQESTYALGASKTDDDEPAAPAATSDDASANNSLLLPCVENLSKKFCNHLGSNFYMVAHNRRAQLQLFVFARITLQNAISNIEKTSENTGFMHVFPNKGGISVCFHVDNTPLAFISSHLAAHEGVFNCYMRNESVKEILRSANAGTNKELDIPTQFHHVFFMGDMNYRVTYDEHEPDSSYEETKKALVEKKKKEKAEKESKTEGVSSGDVQVEVAEELSVDAKAERKRIHEQLLSHIVNEEWEAILEKDELNREVRKGRLLPGFTALQPSFPPTFKRVRGKAGASDKCIRKAVDDTQYPTPYPSKSKDKKTYLLKPSLDGELDTTDPEPYVNKFYNPQRFPAYTDRILYKSLPAHVADLETHFFDSCELVDTSDHKPVHAAFNISTKKVLKDIAVHWEGKSLRNINTLKFEVRNMKATGLSELDLAILGGGSDPYIVLSTDPPEILNVSRFNKLRSKIIKHDLNPNWGAERLTFELCTDDIEGLKQHCHLLIQLWDDDRFNPDDVIGVAVIPFSKIFDECLHEDNQFHSWNLKEPIFHGGEKHGVVECTIQLLNSNAGGLALSKKTDEARSNKDATNFGRGDSFASQPSQSFEDNEMPLEIFLKYRNKGMSGNCCNCTVC